MECMREKNKSLCTCKHVNCNLHGLCCECIRRHREGGAYPHCFDDANCVTMKEKIASMSPETLEAIRARMKQMNAPKENK